MKVSEKFAVISTLIFVCCCRAQVVQHPVNTTVCQDDNTAFTCVIFIPSGAPVTPGWLRNDVIVVMMRHSVTSNLTDGTTAPAYISGTVTVSNVTVLDDGALYHCGISFVTSNSATLNVVVPPATVPTITVPTPLNSRSFNVSWTITDPDHNYIVTWTNLCTDMMSSVTVPENTNSYMVTGLNGVDNYNVSVTANNSCGMMMSDPITVYDRPNAVRNVRIMDEDTTSVSFVVLWDKMMDIFNITYDVTWYNESGIVGMVTVNSSSYTVTGLTANTSYNVTVVAINTCCGAGPVSDVVVAMTNMREPTPPSSYGVTTLSPTSSATPDNDERSNNNGGINTGITLGAVAGIIAVIVFIIIIIIIFYKRKKARHSDIETLSSPDVDETKERYVTTVCNAQSDRVVHDAPDEPVTVPGQTSAAESTEAVNTSQEQTASGETAVGGTRHNTQRINYADLQEIPTRQRQIVVEDLNSAVTYSQIANT